jgi:hypothetical protein
MRFSRRHGLGDARGRAVARRSRMKRTGLIFRSASTVPSLISLSPLQLDAVRRIDRGQIRGANAAAVGTAPDIGQGMIEQIGGEAHVGQIVARFQANDILRTLL